MRKPSLARSRTKHRVVFRENSLGESTSLLGGTSGGRSPNPSGNGSDTGSDNEGDSNMTRDELLVSMAQLRRRLAEMEKVAGRVHKLEGTVLNQAHALKGAKSADKNKRLLLRSRSSLRDVARIASATSYEDEADVQAESGCEKLPQNDFHSFRQLHFHCFLDLSLKTDQVKF